MLARLRQNPSAVSVNEFKASVVNFLHEWGGRHIRGDVEVAGVLLNGLCTLQNKFQSLRNDTLVTVNLDRRGKLIQDIFNRLRLMYWENRGAFRSVTVHLGKTFASKLVHVVNPSLFVMWDDGIASCLCKRKMIESPWDYVGFLKLMQEEAKSVVSDFQAFAGSDDPALFLSRKFKYSITKPLTKFLDEYNWVRSQRNLDKCTPSEWLFRLQRRDHQA